jgi:superfamily II DNA/RNA helicase
VNPIRLLEIMEENSTLVDLSNVTFLIVDEYIQFRKMQAMENVKKLVEKLRPDRQTGVFSRLVPSGIQRQGDEFVKNCIFVEMHHDKVQEHDEIKQIVELCDKNLKSSRYFRNLFFLNKFR